MIAAPNDMTSDACKVLQTIVVPLSSKIAHSESNIRVSAGKLRVQEESVQLATIGSGSNLYPFDIL